MPVCPECAQPFPQRTGPGHRMIFCSLLCRGRAKRKREAERNAGVVRQWYADVAAGRAEPPWWMEPEAAAVLAEMEAMNADGVT